MRSYCRIGISACLLAIVALTVGVAFALDINRVVSSFRGLNGNEAVLRDWQRLLTGVKPLGTMDKLKRVNEFFNHHIQFGDDQAIWGQSDYWATLLETLAKGKGDCEDFTIAKYFTLLDADIPNEQLRLIYVKARIGGPDSSVIQAHMVLAYYATPDADPIVLDNLISELRPARRRPDLQPVFSFNSQGIWSGGAANTGPAGQSKLSRWNDLLKRARAEGFE